MPDTHLTCCDCQAPFVLTDQECDEMQTVADARGQPFTTPRRCHACRRAKRAVIDDGRDGELLCATCGAVFTFTASEKRFYAARHYTLPRRCPACRHARVASESRR
jgi:D-serine deaminase-like pyridoxal phosphate-dependent protein